MLEIHETKENDEGDCRDSQSEDVDNAWFTEKNAGAVG